MHMQVEYGVSGSLERQIRSSSGTETRQLVLPNLEEGTSYEFAVRGVYQGGIVGVDFTVLGSTLETGVNHLCFPPLLLSSLCPLRHSFCATS